MILWQSLRIEVYRDTHDQASTSGDGDQHEVLRGSWMISWGVLRRMRPPPLIVYPNPVSTTISGASRANLTAGI
jgi:hypothetical protein